MSRAPGGLVAKLDAYRQKRDFSSTTEPQGWPPAPGERRFVVQMHAARRLHYDLRLEHEGVLMSWAVPKGPSLDPHVRRLAVRTEDHPVEYADFEGTIPAGQYGGGRMIVWDRGIWQPEGDVNRDLERGRLHFVLAGDKLRGHWHLVRMHDQRDWLLIKSRDTFARLDAERDIVDEQPLSVLSGRSIDELDARPDPSPAPDTDSEPLPLLSAQLSSLASRPPDGPEWLHEIKLDGYRILAFVRPGEVRLRTRGGEDWSAKLPELARMLAIEPLRGCVLDGELCAISTDGLCDFGRLQRAIADGRTRELVYSVFDLPFAAGEDLRDKPLLERKQLLEQLLDSVHDPRIRYWSHVQGSGPQVFTRACALRAEGIISKRIDAPYESRRTRTWLKSKCPHRTSVVIGGFTQPQGSRQHFGALLMGTRDAEGQLHYRGKVGAGFSAATLAELHDQLEPVDEPAFVDPPTGIEARGVTWVRPTLAIDIEYGDLSDQGRYRQARYMGRSLSRNSGDSPGIANVRLTHGDKLLYPHAPGGGLRKRDVADYIMRVAAWMLPHVRGRPLTLVRCVDGIDGECFFQKHATPGLPPGIERLAVPEPGVGERLYAGVSDALGLVALVQLNVLEIHLWGSRIDKLDYPDRLVFDLDPDVELGFERVVEAALELRERLEQLGLCSFVTTTGGKGLHVVVPVEPRHEFGPSKQFCRTLAEAMAADSPDRYVVVATKARRRGKIFIDYLRNGRGATAIAPYSLRARPGAPVATPLAWDELRTPPRPADFDALTLPQRLALLERDPWLEYFDLRQAIDVIP